MKKVAIIGAGISGITLAYKLSQFKKDGADISIDVIDKGSEAGGCIKSINKNGYLVESGPNGVLNSKEHFTDLFISAGLEDNLQLSSDLTRRRYIQLGGELLLAPSGPVSAIRTKLLSFPGKLRVLKEPFIKKKDNDKDESIHSFASRRLGKEFAERIIATLAGGVFAGDAKKLGIKMSFPFMYKAEQLYGSLFKGMINFAKASKKDKKERRTPARDRFKLVSSKSGLQGLVKELADKCEGVSFFYNTNVHDITKKDGLFQIKTDAGEVKAYDILAVCCNAGDAAELLKNVNPVFKEELDKVVFAPVFICGMGFDRKDIQHKLDGFGFLVAPEEKSPVLGAIFSSSIFDNRAPEDKILLTTVNIGDREHRELIENEDKQLETTVYDRIKGVLGIDKEPETIVTFKYDKALPQYYAGHGEIVEKVENSAEEIGNLFIGGNTMRGVSVSNCALCSIELAEKIIKVIKSYNI